MMAKEAVAEKAIEAVAEKTIDIKEYLFTLSTLSAR